MSDNGNGFEPFNGPLVTPFQSPNIASEMIGQNDDIRQLFLSLSYFVDTQEANDFAWCLHKCKHHGLKLKQQLFEYMINARVSVKGWRSSQVVDVLTQIQRLEEQKRIDRYDGSRNKGIKTPNA